MYRSMTAFLIVLASVHSALHAQGKKDDFDPKIEFGKDPVTKKVDSGTKKSGSDTPILPQGIPGEMDILFLNGSKVRALILSDKLEIASIYGKLTVPIQDVQQIEFGLHYPDGTVDKVDSAIKNLGSGDYRVRETAAKTLVELGPFAYPSVLRTTTAKEREIAARAKDIVQKIQAKFPKKDLKVSTDDRVVTPTQTIVGRIMTTTVKTKAEYFGEIEHKLVNMRSLRAVTGSLPEVDVSIDSAKYANSGQWLDSGFQLDGRSNIVITAKGQVDTWPQQPGQYMTGPGGNLRGGGFQPGGGQIMPGGKIRAGNINNNMYGGMLIGKIGEDGEPFIIGDRFEFKAETEGKLFLHIGPSPWNCASAGSYEVKISRKND
jgi:hypothetical protein